MFNRIVVSVAVVALLQGCNCGSGSGSSGGGGGTSASGGGSSASGGGSSAGGGMQDAGFDAGVDAGVDGGSDAGQVDAGPPCGIPVDETVDATLYMSIDDEGTLFINGDFVATQVVPWNAPLVRTIKVNRNPTVPNVVAIEARNDFAQGGVDRAALVDFRLGDGGDPNAPQIFVSDDQWKAHLGVDAGSDDGGWTRLGFDDSTWTPAVAQLNYGDAPYGTIFNQFGINSSNAKWIWAYDSAAAASKPTTEPIFFRRIFYFSADGGFSADAGVCPQ